MGYSNHRHILLNLTSPALFFLVFSTTSPPLVSAQDSSKKVKPSSSAKINIQEIEKREKESPPSQEKKKVENEKLPPPRDLPVPKDAKGKTFKVKPPERKKRVRSRQRRNINLVFWSGPFGLSREAWTE